MNIKRDLLATVFWVATIIGGLVVMSFASSQLWEEVGRSVTYASILMAIGALVSLFREELSGFDAAVILSTTIPFGTALGHPDPFSQEGMAQILSFATTVWFVYWGYRWIQDEMPVGGGYDEVDEHEALFRDRLA